MSSSTGRKRSVIWLDPDLMDHQPLKKQQVSLRAANISDETDVDSTEIKLAILQSLHPTAESETLLECLLSANGSVEAACKKLSSTVKSPDSGVAKRQDSLKTFFTFRKGSEQTSRLQDLKSITRKGTTLHLYTPEEVAQHTPCSIIHNFLKPEQANVLLKELLEEAATFPRPTFQIFGNTVQSHHTTCFFASTAEEKAQQQTEYFYGGAPLGNVRETTPEMQRALVWVEDAVNHEIIERVKTHHSGKKPNQQSPERWTSNAAFVNCYDGGGESVGYHSDQLTYLGPLPVIASLSLGVARQFRVRRMVHGKLDANVTGQIAIHLPHNSLLVMHADMQENWKHSIQPAQVVEPHPIAGNKRINITYRQYRDYLHPRFTPKCKCVLPAVLKCVYQGKPNAGRYYWTCDAVNIPGKDGCSFFQWQDFNSDGRPPWTTKPAHI
ncbi:hypothetical protein MMC25_007131 [Agyrium rufum]|nr:hypothetical protein [Agyrium rufum]